MKLGTQVARSGLVGLRGFALTAAAVRDFGPKRCCCLVVTQPLKVLGEVTGRGQGLGVVVAEDAAPPGEGVGVQVPGRARYLRTSGLPRPEARGANCSHCGSAAGLSRPPGSKGGISTERLSEANERPGA